MAPRAAASGEAMLEDVGERILARRQRHESIANVAGAREPVTTAELAGAAAVVTGGHHRGELRWSLRSAKSNQSTEDSGKPGPAAHRGHPQHIAHLLECGL